MAPAAPGCGVGVDTPVAAAAGQLLVQSECLDPTETVAGAAGGPGLGAVFDSMEAAVVLEWLLSQHTRRPGPIGTSAAAAAAGGGSVAAAAVVAAPAVAAVELHSQG